MLKISKVIVNFDETNSDKALGAVRIRDFRLDGHDPAECLVNFSESRDWKRLWKEVGSKEVEALRV